MKLQIGRCPIAHSAYSGIVPQISGKEVIKVLCRNGFVIVRQKGSHLRLEKNTADGTIKLTVPIHPVLKKGTLHQIIKASGLKEEDFL